MLADKAARWRPSLILYAISHSLTIAALKETKMFVRLKIEDTREGLVATISQRDDDGKVTGRPSIFLVGGKEEAKQRAKAAARALGLKTYRVLDRTSSRVSPPIHPA
jgi:hypothetical protein